MRLVRRWPVTGLLVLIPAQAISAAHYHVRTPTYACVDPYTTLTINERVLRSKTQRLAMSQKGRCYRVGPHENWERIARSPHALVLLRKKPPHPGIPPLYFKNSAVQIWHPHYRTHRKRLHHSALNPSASGRAVDNVPDAVLAPVPLTATPAPSTQAPSPQAPSSQTSSAQLGLPPAGRNPATVPAPMVVSPGGTVSPQEHSSPQGILSPPGAVIPKAATSPQTVTPQQTATPQQPAMPPPPTTAPPVILSNPATLPAPVTSSAPATPSESATLPAPGSKASGFSYWLGPILLWALVIGLAIQLFRLVLLMMRRRRQAVVEKRMRQPAKPAPVQELPEPVPSSVQELPEPHVAASPTAAASATATEAQLDEAAATALGVYKRRCVADLRHAGWDARTRFSAGMAGPDVIATNGSVMLVVRCHPSTDPVGADVVEEACLTREQHRSDIAAIVSTGPFTELAKDLAARTGVVLLHEDELTTFAA